MIRVRSWGIAGSVRDAGRRGWAHLGRSRGGAVDVHSLALANRLVGNDEHVGAFETSGGLVLEIADAALVAVTGSPVDLDVVDGPPLGWGLPTALPPGALVRVGRLRGGARSYVAVRGGVHTGAPGRSADVTADVTAGVTAGVPAGVPAGLAGSVVQIGTEPNGAPSIQAAVPRARSDEIRIWPGPRLDWFEGEAWTSLTSQWYSVEPDSDRVGARLAAASRLRRSVDAELPSEGMVEGAVQVPPDGYPIVMLADHPVTGGYPVIAVVDPADLRHVAQAPPGAMLRFRTAHP